MDSSTSTSDENFEMGFRLSSPSSAYPTDQSFMEITSDAILSSDSFTYCRTNSEASGFDSSEHTDDNSYSEATSPLCWQSHKSPTCVAVSKLGLKQDNHEVMTEEEEAMDLEMELMKERLSKLLLGEDMSGSGKGVCTAVTISNAITNLYASVFGQHQKLEPMHSDKKIMWKREMSCLLSICDYLVEFTPAVQNFKDGTTLTVMKSRPRSDISMNLPALRKLDAMLLEILDSFEETEFWYADQGRASGSSTCSGSFRRVVHTQQHKEEKWWLPVPCVASDGLSEKSKQHLRQKRDCASQIHKAAMAINSAILAEMAIPESYTASLPKSGKASVGDAIYRHMYSVEIFSPDDLLDSLNIRSEHEAIEVADRVEASMYTWRRKMGLSHSKSSWDLVKDLVSDVDRGDKNHVLAERAGNLLFSLKQRYPELAQTTLDTSKIQYNKDVGQAVLESYSRVLEGLAFNIVAWIEDVVCVDCTTINI